MTTATYLWSGRGMRASSRRQTMYVRTNERVGLFSRMTLWFCSVNQVTLNHKTWVTKSYLVCVLLFLCFFAQFSCTTWAPRCSLVPISNGFMAQVRIHFSALFFVPWIPRMWKRQVASNARAERGSTPNGLHTERSLLRDAIRLQCVFTANVYRVCSAVAFGIYRYIPLLRCCMFPFLILEKCFIF